MEAVFVDNIFREAMFLVFMLVTITLVPSLVVGLVVSIFQAATQINEQTLSFLPRLLVTFATMLLAGPWMFARLTDFVETLLISLPYMIK